MNKGSTKMMAMIAVGLQALATVLGLVIVVLQKTVLKAFMNVPSGSDTIVFPLALIFVALQLIIYIAFFSISRKEGNRVTCIILIIISIILAVVSVLGNVVGNIYYARQGVEAIAGYSGLTTLISYVNTLFAIPAEALFYIACGRYTYKPE
ncbi:MAG: hypothetical protein K6B28_11095 [Lachnospiraceae bacterium]|nr:hypothetical protein [Lachnospiraceae bacterium]